jgi:hypothetical protein
MTRSMPAALLIIALLAGFAAPKSSYGAITLGFQNISANNTADAESGETQLNVEVRGTADDASLGLNQVRFVFRNSGPNASSITDIYFDDGTLLGIAAIEQDGDKVEFSQGAHPKQLPGGNTVGFTSTASFSIDSDPPAQPNGVNPGESVAVVFNLLNGLTYADVVAALSMSPTIEGSLGIGIHVQGFEGGGSESFVTDNYPPPSVVPEPVSVLVWGGLGICAVAMEMGRRRRMNA